MHKAAKSAAIHAERERTNEPITCATKKRTNDPPTIASANSSTFCPPQVCCTPDDAPTRAGATMMANAATISASAAATLPNQIDAAPSGREK